MFSNSLRMGPNGLAGIQYLGLPGISQSCFDAIKRLVQCGTRIERAKIVTAENSHCLMVRIESEGWIAVKSGFSSGYSGEGPRTFAETLALLRAYGVEFDECEVSSELLDRLDASALTVKDVDSIQTAKIVRPTRWHDYIHDAGLSGVDTNTVWQAFPPVMPWSIIDARITDLALKFFDSPDDSILTGFRRLEDGIRKRLPPNAKNTRLFAQAFQGDTSALTWKDIEPGEHNGRGQLFTGAYMAYRNPRAHRELKRDQSAMLAEFLLLNQLYTLEKSAIERPADNCSPKSG